MINIIYITTDGRSPRGKRGLEWSALVSDRFILDVDDEWTDSGRDGRTCLARPKSLARTGPGKNNVPCSADDKQEWEPYGVILPLLGAKIILVISLDPSGSA